MLNNSTKSRNYLCTTLAFVCASLSGLVFDTVPVCGQQTTVLPPAGVSLGVPRPLQNESSELELEPSRPTQLIDIGLAPKKNLISVSAPTSSRNGDDALAELAIPTTEFAVRPSPQDDELLPKPAPAIPAPTPAPTPAPELKAVDALPVLPEDVIAIPQFDSRAPRSNQQAPAIDNQTMEFAPQAPSAGIDVDDRSDTTGTPNSQTTKATGTANSSASKGPEFFVVPAEIPYIDPKARRVPIELEAFAPSVHAYSEEMLDPFSAELIYRGKFAVPVQRPLIEWGRPLYTGGIYPPGKNWFGPTNLVMPHFMVYGDFRTGVGINRNAQGDANVWANRLNLDMDLKLTATERIHAFMGPLDRGGDFTRVDFSNGTEFVDRTDMRLDTLFFEGDAGAIVGGLNGVDSPFDLPFTFGFIPLIYQNGIWANDNVIGAAFAIPTRHSRLLNWSNYDATFFWASDQVTTDAFAGDNNAAEFFGTAWFIDAYDGYIEANYAFVNDDVGGDRSYHNLSFAFTRRYFSRVSNSIRYITNLDQQLPDEQKTASGHLVLLENSLITSYPNTLVPYLNLFYGQGRPQSLARAGGTGGVLNNVGINFETDGLTGYPTLDVTGHNAYGAALGVNLLGSNFSHQLVLEAAALGVSGSEQFRNAPGDQFAFGARYQRPLSNAWLFRTDHMYGWLRNSEDIRGSRVELRWKF